MTDGAPADAPVDASDAGPALAPMNLHFDGQVTATVRAAGAWYFGGRFSTADAIPAPKAIALRLDGAPSPCPLEAGFNQEVTAVVEVGGAVYLGGSFTTYRGQPANRIAKLDATTCALDTTFSPSAANGFNEPVTALASDGTSLFVTGFFTAYRGVVSSANRIAKLSLATGALDTTFSPAGATANGFDENGRTLAVHAGSVYVGGGFTAYRGAAGSARYVAKLDAATGALDTTFSPPASNGCVAPVYSLAVSGGALYVGGDFTACRGTAVDKIAKLDLGTGAVDTTFSPQGAGSNGFNDRVIAVAASGSAIYVGGIFTAFRGTANSALHVAKLNPTTGAIDTTFSPPGATTNGFGYAGTPVVTSLAVSGTSLFVGGVFSSYRGAAGLNNVAKLDATSGAFDATFLAPGSTRSGIANGYVSALGVTATRVWLGGTFGLYGGKSAQRIARFDEATGAFDATFSPPASNGFDNGIRALAASSDALYVGGDFTAYRGAANSARRLAKLDLRTGAIDATFSPPGATSNGFEGSVMSLAVAADALYVGGAFTSYRGVPDSANRLAKLDLANGAIDTTFSPVGATTNGVGASVYALAVAGPSLFVGGTFQSYRGVADSANRIAKLDRTSGNLDATFSPAGATANGFDNGVSVLAVAGGSVYAGGWFNAYRGVANSARRIARLDAANGALDTTFSPPGATANGFDEDVNGLGVIGSSLLLGGDFTAYRGVAGSAAKLAKVDLVSGALDPTFTPSGASDMRIYAMHAANNLVVLGGDFFVCRFGTCAKDALRIDAVTGRPR